eukprot:CAMPEP_0197888306 /NCGR_PEP_ID=MMETSP1439-20131203/21918_1 /TAXON_ID=66791 /ORGANISM="Gonyaulax spinifera, Strain CCMP409" /LENGTH=399 /DNA_ID=CAMNT_0043508213 /DNA_START=81 /DNA_END=1280 /DNA_ORIENTATION=-
MGNLPAIIAKLQPILSIKVNADQPSIDSPGELSVVTDIVGPDVCPDIQEFFDELVHFIMDPLWPGEWLFLKEVRFTKCPDDPEKTTIKVFLDIDKIKKFSKDFTHPKDELVRLWLDVFIKPKEYHIYTEEFRADLDVKTKMAETHSKFHPEEEGFRVEAWCFDHEGKRHAGPVLAWITETMFLKPLLCVRIGQKVVVRSNVEMPESGGKSIVTGALDEYFTQQHVFDSLVRLSKQDTIDQGGQITYNSDSDFVCYIKHEIPIPKPQEAPAAVEDGKAAEDALAAASPLQSAVGDEKEAGAAVAGGVLKLEITKSIVLIPEMCQMVMTEHIGEELGPTRFVRIHKDPVKLETWIVLPNGERSASGKEACGVRLLLMKLLSEIQIDEEVKDLDSAQDNFYF